MSDDNKQVVHLQQLHDDVLTAGIPQPDLEVGVVGGCDRQRRAGAHCIAFVGFQRCYEHIHAAQLVQVCSTSMQELI